MTGYGDQSLQFLDCEGNVQDEDYYSWFNEKQAWKTAPAGWYNMDGDPAERDIEPGQSFLISNDEGECTANIPGVNDVIEE